MIIRFRGSWSKIYNRGSGSGSTRFFAKNVNSFKPSLKVCEIIIKTQTTLRKSTKFKYLNPFVPSNKQTVINSVVDQYRYILDPDSRTLHFRTLKNSNLKKNFFFSLYPFFTRAYLPNEMAKLAKRYCKNSKKNKSCSKFTYCDHFA